MELWRKRQLALVDAYEDAPTLEQFSADDPLRDDVLNMPLDQPLDGSRTVPRIVLFLQNPVDGVGLQHDLESCLLQLLVQLTHFLVHNSTEMLLTERVEDDHLVEPVQEFWVEGLLDLT